MKRSKRIIVASHCILNQNTVIQEEARSKGIMKSAVEWCEKKGYGVVQLPCPEFTFLGPTRPSMTREEYDTQEYREHSRSILIPIIQQLQMYQENGYEIVGGFGIQESPSCDFSTGVFMEEFFSLAQGKGIHINHFWQIPATENGYFDENDARNYFTK